MIERYKDIIELIAWPVAYFIAGLLIFLAVVIPAVKPLAGVLSIVTLEASPDFDSQAADIFDSKDVSELSGGNDLISVSPSDIPTEGERYGQIISDEASIDAPLYYGDGDVELAKGVGTYSGFYIPGSGRTILLAGHNNTFFHNLDALESGNIIKINTSYGKYEYTVTDSLITKDTDRSAYNLSDKTKEVLILYTCYPFNMIGLTPDRYFVYAEYSSGPKLDLAF
ncbi:MAG: class D sortase [Clostridiales bacterium]|jgi:sortase A|nr:class D sortase [Clostridiales bacterium]